MRSKVLKPLAVALVLGILPLSVSSAYADLKANIDSKTKSKNSIGPTGLTGSAPAGKATGDMQWWNGSAWVMIPVGAHNTTLKNCNGIPTWVVASCPGFLIGDTGPAGGKVFFLTDATGMHGLEAAPVDQETMIWGCDTMAVGVTSDAIGTGKANTAAITAKCGSRTAAQIAASYSLNGVSDWFLPSKDELNLLYLQKSVVGGFTDYNYWSSTEAADSKFAWFQYFGMGYQQQFDKFSLFSVRAIRAF